MITETAHFDTTKSNTMVATDQSTNDFTNCENKSDQLNVVSAFTFKSTTTSTATKLTVDENISELDNYETNEDVTDFGRPKKLQKSLNQSLTANNLINQQQTNSIFGQLESDFNNLNNNLNNLKSTTKSQQIFKTTNNDLINDQSNEQSTSRRKQNLIDNEYNDYEQCSIPKDNSPKVPPLRIVISSSSSTGRNSKDINQTNSNEHSSINYVVSTTSVDSTTNYSNNNDKKDDFYSINNRSTINQQSQQQSNQITTTTSTTGRITRSQRAALNHHLINDDSQTRYSSPDELSNEYSSETNELYLANSQNLKEKESNKENKDLKRRKGRNKGLHQSNQANNSSTSTNLNTTTATSATNSNSQQPTDGSSNNALIDEQLDETINLTNVNLPSNSRDFQMPAYNCLNLFQNIRKQVEKRRQTICDAMNSKSSPKPPQGYKNYLLTTGNYLLENRIEPTRNVNPNLTILDDISVPDVLKNLKNSDELIEMFKEQELEREKLRVQHLVEREKIKLTIEQEILRVHNRASLAAANQSLPLSFTVLLKDEEVYNNIEDTDHNLSHNNLELATHSQKENTTTKNEYSRVTYSLPSNNQYADLYQLTGKSEDIGSRCRYSGRLLHSWLQDVEDKWFKIKKEIINRQKRESESLQAIQKLNWEWKIRELAKKIKIEEETKTGEKFNDKQWSNNLLFNNELIPLIKINNEFDFN